jgi:hypothetical protein
MKKEVKNKWQTEGDLAVIYNVDGILLFYSKNKDPRYTKGQKLTQEEAEQSGAYKALKYSNDNIPSDAFIDLNFAWAK